MSFQEYMWIRVDYCFVELSEIQAAVIQDIILVMISW